MRRFWIATLVFLALGRLDGSAGAMERLVIVQEVMVDGNAPATRRSEFLDTTFHVSGRRTHAYLTFGNFAAGLGIGGFLADPRGSTYGLSIRRRQEGSVADLAVTLETGQTVAAGLVAIGSIQMMRPDVPETDAVLWVPTVGTDLYYGGYSFASLRAVFDPRPNTGILFRIANRFGGRNAHVELALAPRTDGVVNYSVAMQLGYLIAGYSRERDFDFTRLDRRAAYLGFRYDFQP